MRSGVAVWPRVMERENMGLWERKGAVYGLYNGREQEREALEEREREKMRSKEECGPSNGNKLGPIRIESGFESGLD